MNRMPIFRKNLRQRRLEVRRAAPDRPTWTKRYFSRKGSIRSLLIALGFFLLASVMDVLPRDPLPYRLGQVVPADITARVDFRVLDEKLLAEASQRAASATPATFELDAPLLDEIIGTLEKFPGRLETAGSLDQVKPALREQLGLTLPASTQPATTQPVTAPTPQQQKVFDAWVALADPEARTEFEQKLTRLREALMRMYVIRPDRASEQIDRAARHVLLTDGESTVTQKIVDLVEQDDRQKLRRLLDAPLTMFPPTLRQSVERYLLSVLSRQPIYTYDAETAAAAQAAAQRILENPPDEVFKKYGDGSILVKRTLAHAPAGRTLRGLGPLELQLLAEEHEAYLQAERQQSPLRPWLRVVARVMVMALLTGLMLAYIGHYQPDLIEQNSRGLALAGLLVLMLGLTKLTVWSMSLNPHVTLLAVCMAGIVLSIAYDQRFALAVGSILSAFVIFQLRGNFSLLVVLLAGLMACVFQLHQIRSRSKVTLTGVAAAGVVFLAVWAMSLRTSGLWDFALRDSLWAAGSVLLAGLVVQALLPAVEKLFGVVTDSTLLEWCDVSRPLLKRLSIEAPGTYNHCLQLGAMCEAAAETIGARGLLARVGAYYHDIGKLNKPEYFAENETGQASRHEKLSPAMSLLIIINHVKDGLEMARKYALPTQLREFIATHHGTMLVSFFYHNAKEQSEEGKGPKPDENQFRYPGPKPQHKEPAILMLADAAESSVRSLSEPTPTSIRTQVHKMVNLRLEDGQLDECDLTLRAVHAIEASLIKSLCGMYHGRIAYPAAATETNGKKGKAENGKPQASTSPQPDEKQPAGQQTATTQP